MFKITRIQYTLLFCFIFCGLAYGQIQVIQDYSNILTIPDTKTLSASSSHLYVLSQTEGMVVFRAYQDSLQWLYTSAGMQRRGNIIETDIRFAYLYGNSHRLTVLEPTSVLGVYSSTLLPSAPTGIARLQNNLYIALGNDGLGTLSLDTPETVDSEVEIIQTEIIGRANVLDVTSSFISGQLFVLTDDQKIHVFIIEEDALEFSSTVELNTNITSLFLDEGLIWGTANNGTIFQINANGIGNKIGAIKESVRTILFWNNHLFVEGNSGTIWLANNGSNLALWKNGANGNQRITKSDGTVWVSSFDKLSPLKPDSVSSNVQDEPVPSELAITPINNVTLTFPKPLLIGLELDGNYPIKDVEFSYRSNTANASIKGQGFYWQPSVNQVGLHRFTIIAVNAKGQIDSTRFTVDVLTFNAPPRFSPIRNLSIVVNDPYEITFKAIDPENPTSTLIRYLGVDLPEGAILNENTGQFTWTPSERQLGKTSFKIIATDAQGAAVSQDITLTVIDITGEGR